MALAALAILGRRSAHSFPIGPVMAEPEQKSTEMANHRLRESGNRDFVKYKATNTQASCAAH